MLAVMLLLVFVLAMKTVMADVVMYDSANNESNIYIGIEEWGTLTNPPSGYVPATETDKTSEHNNSARKFRRCRFFLHR